ncbi:hypothetical protein [Planctomyces sp. SH-PL14]|uniref:[protein-PII] uridylyltransferase family protein n=1 Tax=Planctomyces sp. SH-PL14 TaxID=1632864 RepID=UPI00078B65EE|nr:hypothetical protein [Planctomyces sp. SH-PL14]AMV18980.1 Glutamate-ammonia-ligase adenylyltransferase [Planctomyces sp. SH-PL14]
MPSSDRPLFAEDALQRFVADGGGGGGDGMSDEEALAFLAPVGFEQPPQALRRLRKLAAGENERGEFVRLLLPLLYAFTDAASADSSLINFERFVFQEPDRLALYRKLADQPRSVEILVKLFVGSQFLTEILLRNPGYLDRLTQHQRLPEIKSRERFAEEARKAAEPCGTYDERLMAVRRFQQWETLRLAACDTFGLMDLKAVTLQLALLADAMTQVCLGFIRKETGIAAEDFVVLAFGKLGGEELNYSSDLDFVFLCEKEAERYWGIGQKLIRAMTEATALGFMYRVDMRLRPWGKSGPLVCTVASYLDYLKKNGQLWEKQALLKARPIAGNLMLGYKALNKIDDIIFDVEPDEVRESVRDMKAGIETALERSGRLWGQVKGGKGSIRDVEFLTQYLQLAYGGRERRLRSKGTLDGLIRLAEFDFIQADEYRQLSGGYVFLRTVEHALQLLHNQAEHALPDNPRELAYLAGRLDFAGAAGFLQHFEGHCRAIRGIFEKYILDRKEATASPVRNVPASVNLHLGDAAASYQDVYSPEQTRRHLEMLQELRDDRIVRVRATPRTEGLWELTLVGYDQLGELSVMCGLMVVHGIDIQSGFVLTGAEIPERLMSSPGMPPTVRRRRKFINVFLVRPSNPNPPPEIWTRYEQELQDLLQRMRGEHAQDIPARLARRVAQSIDPAGVDGRTLLPVSITIDNNAAPDATVLHIRAEDTPGFLYELTNALALTEISIQKVIIQSQRNQIHDTLYVTDRHGQKILDFKRINELRAAVVLIKHFTHLLPQCPNPETALLHFREFLAQLFEQPDWLDSLASLHQPEVLETLSRLMGMSEFLWADFLKLQHRNLFPVVTDVTALKQRKTLDDLTRELDAQLAAAETFEARRAALNLFKDREMLRVDLRHITNAQPHFALFSRELTDIAETVVNAAVRISLEELTAAHGLPRTAGGEECRFCVCALGKCGGRELGFASDIELLFLYEHDGQTDGASPTGNTEFFDRLIDMFRKAIDARRQGIFEIDLRLRPYGRAGSLAVSVETFERYFGPAGPAWPFERQALVRLRPIGGSPEFAEQVVAVRDRLIYTGAPFDVAAMRAMRQKQITQHVTPGTFNAKLSPGGLVDIEYLVQGLQITYGAEFPNLRVTNTREVMKELEQAGILTTAERIELRDAYRFLRRLIDALRIVRGDARDLTVPSAESDEYEFLVRRMKLFNDTKDLGRDIEQYSAAVRQIADRLFHRITPRSAVVSVEAPPPVEAVPKKAVKKASRRKGQA